MMRRVAQQVFVDVDEDGVRKPDSSGDCFAACIASIFELPLASVPGMGGNVQPVFDWLALNFPGIGVVDAAWDEPRKHHYRTGYWIATIISSRFREATGPGYHAVVMENAQRVWDPHPQADWDAPLQITGETYFVVIDPARLSARSLPTLAVAA